LIEPKSTNILAQRDLIQLRELRLPGRSSEPQRGRFSMLAFLRPGIVIWREKLYAFMTRNAVSAWEYFQIPPKRVVELGTQVEL
jgi:K+ transporter